MAILLRHQHVIVMISLMTWQVQHQAVSSNNDDIIVLMVNYGISNTIVLEIWASDIFTSQITSFHMAYQISWPLKGVNSSHAALLHNEKFRQPGSCFNIKTIFPGIGIPIIKIVRLFHLYNGNSIPEKWLLYIELAPDPCFNRNSIVPCMEIPITKFRGLSQYKDAVLPV